MAGPVIGLAPDSFKGTLTALQAAEALAEGVRRVLTDATLELLPMADGGEGTADLLVSATRGENVPLPATDPLGRPIEAHVGRLGAAGTWAVDTAAATGLTLLAPDERDPLRATSQGTGELIRQVIQLGARTVILGLGGSATVDGGLGLCLALGFRFLDEHGQPLPPGGNALHRLHRIVETDVPAAVRRVVIRLACDVENPLTGPEGAARTFGPQKGATPDQVRTLERGLDRLAQVIRDHCVHHRALHIHELPGTGAAGGIGATLHALLDAPLEPGAALVFSAAGYADRLARCQLVITGEGRLDAQTARGKAPAVVAARAAALGIPALAVAGQIASDCPALPGLVDTEACFASLPEEPLTSARAAAALADATERLVGRFDLPR